MNHHLVTPARPGGTRRRVARRLLAAAAATTMVVGVAATSQAATKVTVTNPGGLVAVGPTNLDYGFPSYYEDSKGVRVEPCLDATNALCGFLPGDVPNPDAPIAFPDNFPGEFFYQLIDSSLTLPAGGKVTLTLGLEAAFANDDPIQGDQLTFARTRIVVVGGPRSTTLRFQTPFGEATVDTDATGKGRLVQDIAPAQGNFTTALGSNFGPFLRWDPAVAPAAPAGFLGDPAQQHAVIGGKGGYNAFTAWDATGAQLATTNLFGVSGKIATNTGVTGDRAEINGTYLDVFATTAGDQIQVEGVPGQYATTPMSNDHGRHYARVALLDGAHPTSVKVTNLGDKPVASATIKVADVKINEASFDGSKLVVQVDSPTYPVTVQGFGDVTGNGRTSFETTAPPATITVTHNGGSTTVPVTISGGNASDPALPPVTPAPNPGPVYDNTGDNPAPPVTQAPVASVAAPAATLPGSSVTLDASGSTNATSYTFVQKSGPTVNIAASGNKATATLPYFTTTSATAPAAAWAPIVVTVTATGSGGSSTADVTIPVKSDSLTVTGRHRLGTELRIDGTELIDGVVQSFVPQTQVVIWQVTGSGSSATYTKLTSAGVDTLGAFAVRQKPGPSGQISTILVQSSRGGTITAALAPR